MHRQAIVAAVFLSLVAGCGSEASGGDGASDGGSALDTISTDRDTTPRSDSGADLATDSATGMDAGSDVTDTAVDDSAEVASDASADGSLDGADDGDGAPLAPDDSFAKAWAHGICDDYDKCCAAAGKTEDHAACEATVQAWIATYIDAARARGSVIDPTKLAGCTAALATSIDECTDESVLTRDLMWRVDTACYPALIGTKHPGERCETAFDCIQTPGAKTTCLSYSGPAGSGVICQEEHHADVGEPCNEFSDDPVVHTCDSSKSLSCIGDKCVRNPGAGETCFVSKFPSCDLADHCVGTTCETRLDVGGACASADDCKAGLRCDATKKCAPLARVGEACAGSEDCASSTCSGGKCDLHFLFFGPVLTSACK